MSLVLKRLSLAFILIIGFAGSYLWYSVYLFVLTGVFLVFIQKKSANSNVTILPKDWFFLGLILFSLIGNYNNMELIIKKLILTWAVSFIFQNIHITRKDIGIIYMFFVLALSYQVFKMTFYDLGGHLSLDYTRLLKFSQTKFYLNAGEEIGTTYYGTYVALLFIILFVSFRFYNKYTYFRLALLLFVIVLNIIAVKRAYWLALVLFSFIVLFHNQKSSKVYFRYIVVLLSLITVFYIIMPYLKFLNLDELYYRIDSFVDSGKADESLGLRFYRWGLSLELLTKNPFGIGYTYFYDTFHIGTTHNEYLAYALGYGIFGLIFYLLILIYYYRVTLKNFSSSNPFYYLKMLGLGVLVLITIMGFTENYSYANKSFNLYLWVILGLQGNPIVSKYIFNVQ